MTAKRLQELLADFINEHGDLPVMVNTATFLESENGSIFECDDINMERVQGVDDSGPVGRKYQMLVITGPVQFHAHGNPI